MDFLELKIAALLESKIYISNVMLALYYAIDA